MPQFFIDKKYIVGNEVLISGGDAHHILHVLRLAKGDWIVLSDGMGRSFKAIITDANPKGVQAAIKKELTRPADPSAPVLALAMIRNERFEWALQKAVELGCGHIIPIVTARTLSHMAKSGAKKLSRWRLIAMEAAKQSGLPFRPSVEGPLKFDDLCRTAPSYDSAVLFFEGEEKSDMRIFWKTNRPEGRYLLVIGPEGGFTGDEIKRARDAGMKILSLGRQILRVETAAVSALAIWQYELGNMDII